MSTQRPIVADPGGRQGRIFVMADRRSDRERLRFLIARAPSTRDASLVEAPFAAGAFPLGLSGSDIVFVVLTQALDARVLERLDQLARNCGLVVIAARADAHMLDAATISRAWALLEREGLSVAVVEAAASTVVRARRSEDRLIAIAADQVSMLSRLRRLRHRLEMSVEDGAERLREALAAKSTVHRDRGNRARHVAHDALDALREAEAELASLGVEASGALRASRPPDLNRVVEAFVAAFAGEPFGTLSALTSADPILLDGSGEALDAFLRALVRPWADTAHSADALELIVWDAGEEARIAAVFSRPSSDLELDFRAPLPEFIEKLLDAAHPLAQACRARLELTPAALPAASCVTIMIGLAKRGVGTAPVGPRLGAAPSRLVV